jgi:uncharacterized integral membrane protein
VRLLQSILLFILVMALVTFVFQNTHVTKIQFLRWSAEAPIAAVCLGLYLLGMFSGGAVFSFIKRSIRAVRERRKP